MRVSEELRERFERQVKVALDYAAAENLSELPSVFEIQVRHLRDIGREIFAVLATLPDAGAGVRVKALEWTDQDGWSQATGYRVEVGDNGRFYARSNAASGLYATFGFANSMGEAKVAAQADYEQRILASIETGASQPAEAERIAELEAEVAWADVRPVKGTSVANGGTMLLNKEGACIGYVTVLNADDNVREDVASTLKAAGRYDSGRLLIAKAHNLAVSATVRAETAEAAKAAANERLTEAGRDSIETYYERQIRWSRETFGPALRTKGVIDHIGKELKEIEADPHDLSEWIDVVILAMDGFWRHGGTVSDLMPRLFAKQQKNMARSWPDWRTASPDKAIEHDRTGEPTRTFLEQQEASHAE